MLLEKNHSSAMGFMGLMALSALMSIPLYVMMREMSDSLKEIADKVGR